MKPIVIYAENKEKITLTRKEFEKYLSEAFDAGYAEGYTKGLSRIYTPITWTASTTDHTPVTYNPLNISSPTSNEWTVTMGGEVTNTIGD